MTVEQSRARLAPQPGEPGRPRPGRAGPGPADAGPGGGAAASRTAPARGARHLPGLDGLRALAIAAVLVYHLDPRWLPGGFLGVDVFFVVSGFLITTLLVDERRRTGRVDLPAFWTRRARRLLPALAVCVPASILLARLVESDLLVGIGRQALGALTFSTNWVEVAAGADYFDRTAPALFMNFWSLAVEEQFYLGWPLVLLGLLALPLSGRGRAGVVTVLGLLSALLMALRYDPDGGATRVYYGTDTHLTGLMLGAALALAREAPHRAWTTTPAWERWRRPALGGAAATLVVLAVVLTEDVPATFRGGILLACAATTVLLAGVLDRPGRLRALLETRPLTWVGRRSYGLYLWHWPVILVVGQDLPTAPGSTSYLLTRGWCVLVTVALADLSYRLLETPVRRYGFGGAARRAVGAVGGPGGRSLRLAATGVALASLVTAAVVVTAPDRSSTQRILEENAAAARQGASASPSPTGADPAGGGARRADFSMPTGREIDGFGDSMMVGSLQALEYYFPGIRLDARSNRRWTDGLAAVRASGDGVRRAVVLAFGTNAGVDAAATEQVLDELGPDRMVVLVNIHARFPRVEADNARLERVARAHPNVAVADWDAAVSDHPDQLQPDGIHPSLVGAHLYAKTVRRALADLSEAHTGRPVTLKDLPIP